MIEISLSLRAVCFKESCDSSLTGIDKSSIQFRGEGEEGGFKHFAPRTCFGLRIFKHFKHKMMHNFLFCFILFHTWIYFFFLIFWHTPFSPYLFGCQVAGIDFLLSVLCVFARHICQAKSLTKKLLWLEKKLKEICLTKKFFSIIIKITVCFIIKVTVFYN